MKLPPLINVVLGITTVLCSVQCYSIDSDGSARDHDGVLKVGQEGESFYFMSK